MNRIAIIRYTAAGTSRLQEEWILGPGRSHIHGVAIMKCEGYVAAEVCPKERGVTALHWTPQTGAPSAGKESS